MFLWILWNSSPVNFAASSKPPSRKSYRTASYPRTQQRDQDVGLNPDQAIKIVVKTTPLPSLSRCRLV